MKSFDYQSLTPRQKITTDVKQHSIGSPIKQFSKTPSSSHKWIRNSDMREFSCSHCGSTIYDESVYSFIHSDKAEHTKFSTLKFYPFSTHLISPQLLDYLAEKIV